MTVNLDRAKEIFYSWGTAIITILIVYLSNGIGKEKILLAIIHSFFTSYTLIYILNLVETENRVRGCSGASCFLLVSVLYNQNSIVKFLVDDFFDGFISDNATRFFGGIYIDIIIFISAYIWKKIRCYKINQRNIFLCDAYFCSSFTVYIFLIGYLLYKIFLLDILPDSRIFLSVNEIIDALICSIVLINIRINKRNVFKSKNANPLIALLILNFIISIISGGKGALVRFGFNVFCGLLCIDKLSFSLVKKIFIISPLLLQGFTKLTEVVSGRMDKYPSYIVLRYHAFRYDLSDMAITISQRIHQSDYSFQVIKEAILYALPSGIFNIDKENIFYDGFYYTQLASIGLSKTEDYNDTVFSMGAQIGGYFGMFICFLGMLLLFEFITIKLKRLHNIGIILLITIIDLFTLVESDWNMLIWNLRDTFIYIIIGYFIFYFVVKIKKGIWFRIK